MKKFELTSEFITNVLGTKLFRIKALVEFGDVSAGELGGYIEKEGNLSQDGNAWVYDNAKVSGNARVSGNAWVYDNACVSGNAKVSGNACVSDNACVSGNARVYGDADYATAKGFGSVFRTTTFFRTKDKAIGVSCGCFYGTLEEFRDKVRETHGDSKTAKEYLMLADLMEYKFSCEMDVEEEVNQ